jgi:predicted ribosome quality control (RQC) complex YloA/Tae2 family protein
MENHSANYFTIRRFALTLNKALASSIVLDILSLNKEEILFLMNDGSALKVYLGNESFAFTVSNPQAAHKGLHFFPEVQNLKVLNVEANAHDRSFRIALEDGLTLVINLYGRNGNIILFRDNIPARLFRNHVNDHNRRLEDYLDVSFTSENSPALTPMLKSFVKDFSIQDTEGFFLHSPVFLPFQPKDAAPIRPILSLIPVNDAEEFSDIEEALHLYAARYFRWKQFNTLYDSISKKISSEIKLYEQYCTSSKKQLHSLEHEKDYRHQADLIMANLGNIPPRASKVLFTDFYTGLPVDVKLRENMPPQKWAEKLYQKARNQEIEKSKALENLISNEEKLETLKEQQEALNSIINYKELKTFSASKLNSGKEDVVLPYRKFSFEGYDILAGKKSESNDQLTFSIARKDDLFLHARDVAGSHVIIRNPTRKPIPPSVLEKAASLAAWYSKGKSSSLCPVSYTLRKYVRKARNAAPGQVIIEKEKVLIVPPAPFGD